MTAHAKIISQDHVEAARAAVFGADPASVPTDRDQLDARLSFLQPGVREALDLLMGSANAKHLEQAMPVVYTVLEAAARAFPEDMKVAIKPKAFIGSIAAVGTEARAVLTSHGQKPSTTRSRQPAVALFLDQLLTGETGLSPGLTQDERIGHVALALGALRAVDRHLAGVERPFVKTQAEQGRNDTCNCGSGKKYKKCCGASKAA